MATRATRSPRGGAARAKRGRQAAAAPTAAAGEYEDVAARAARLGITPERVLLEYARIAFADLRHIVEGGPDGINIKPLASLSPEDAAAISEIVAGAGSGRPRVKLYDKKAALDAIARHLGMFPAPPPRRQPDETAADAAAEEEEENPHEFLARELARLAAAGGQG